MNRISEEITRYEKSSPSNRGAEIEVKSHRIGARFVYASIRIIWPGGIEKYRTAKYPRYWWDEEDLRD